MHTLIATAKLNDIDPQAWLADVLRRINDHPASRLREFVPWNWGRPSPKPPPPNRDSPDGEAPLPVRHAAHAPERQRGPAMLDTRRRRTMNCRHFGQPEPAFERHRSTALVAGLTCPPL